MNTELPDTDLQPKLVQSMADQTIGVPSVPQAPDMSALMRPMPRPAQEAASPSPDRISAPVQSMAPTQSTNQLPVVDSLEEAEQLVNSPQELTTQQTPEETSSLPMVNSLDEAEQLVVPSSDVAPSSSLPTVSSFDEANTLSQQNNTVDDLVNNPNKFSVVKNYMVDRFGEQWNNRPPEETVDTFMKHMRWQNANSLQTLAELRHTMLTDEKNMPKIKNAYDLYDQLDSFLTNDGVGGAISGAKDYALATALDPLTYVGGLIGGKLATKVAGGAAKEAVINQAMKGAFRMGKPELADQIAKTYAKDKAIIAAVGGVRSDLVLNTVQDYTYQANRMISGNQEEYDPIEGALAATGSVLGGAIAYIPQAVRGSTKLGRAPLNIEMSQAKRAAKAPAVAGPKVAESIKKSVDKMNTTLTEWQKAVKAGKEIDPSITDMSNVTAWFFDKNDPDSLFRILHDSGAKFNLDDDVNFTSELIDYARKLPNKDIDEINETLKPFGLKFGEMLDTVAATQSLSGVNLSRSNTAKQYAKAVAAKVAENNKVNTAILGGIKSLGGKPQSFDDPQVLRYTASLWRRMLVSNPATSAVNVLGWGQAYLARSASEALHGGVLGSAGLVDSMLNGKWNTRALGQSKALFENQIFKLRSLLDPYSSYDAFNAALSAAPEKFQEQARHSVFGGIESREIPASMGVNPENKFVKGAEKVADVAARATFVKAQDMITKTFSGIGELDRLSRLEYGKGIDDLIANGDYHLISDDMWQQTLNTMAKDTFSADYTKGNGVGKIAKIVEEISNAPGIGFLFPFGRFMNNNLAFMTEYSPIGLLPIASNLFKKSAFDTTEKISKVAVGTMALATLINYSQGQQERGNAWFEYETGQGTTYNNQNLAPASMFLVAARIGNLIKRGEAVPAELWPELIDQIGVGQWSKEVNGQNALTDLGKRFTEADPITQRDFIGLAQWAVEYAATVGAGFTRPLDPINKVVGMGMGNDVTVDKKMAKSGLDQIAQEMTRYTSAFFAPLIGIGETEEGVKTIAPPLRSSTGPAGDIRDPNPAGSILSLKEQTPKTPIEQLLAQVNIPTWTFQQRSSSPEYGLDSNQDLFMNNNE